MKRFMRRFRKQFRHGEKGFTLIELLVVIAILGALVAIAVPSVANFIGRGKEEAKTAEKYNVVTVVSAALAEGTAGSVTAIGSAGVEIVWVADLTRPITNPDDPRSYLLNNTVYLYSVDTDGTITGPIDPP